MSKLTASQFTARSLQKGNEELIVTLRYDDRCRNGHNTFSITGELREQGIFRSGGCLHEKIAEWFPDLAPFIKWHLCSSDGPLYYIENTTYHASSQYWDGQQKARLLDAARRSAIWLDATDEDLTAPGLEDRLRARLPKLMHEFREAMESLGFTY